jgi:hypothetical protein
MWTHIRAVLSGPATDDLDVGTAQLQSTGGDHLFILNAPENWLTSADSWVSYSLFVDDRVLSSGVHAGVYGQRLPISVIGVKSLTPGSHAFDGQWSTTAGMTASQGGAWPTQLIGL